MLAKTHAVAVLGLQTYAVEVEADVASIGIPRFDIVGLPDAAVSESRDRVRCALRSSRLKYPDGRITVNLAPADLRKAGPAFDLAIALAIAAANREVDVARLREAVAIGELALDGKVRSVPGVLPAAIYHHQKGGGRTLLIPRANRREASHVRGLDFVSVDSLREAVDLLNGHVAVGQGPCETDSLPEGDVQEAAHDFSEVKGQPLACRALQVLAAGGHNALMVGPPGGGKSMLASCVPGILPPLTQEDSLEVTQIYSVAGALTETCGILRRAPYRAPHHSCSPAGLIGGGSVPRPGEISLAHCGTLFLDEALEFPRFVLETLRQPLESGVVTLSRAQVSVTYPARIMLLLALNPCPCGNLGDRDRRCACSPHAVERYRSRLSGPLLDRVDIHLEVNRCNLNEREQLSAGPSSRAMLEAVASARERQRGRLADGPWLNARIRARDVARFCQASVQASRFLASTAERLGWSMRTHQRVLRLARTVADLDGCDRLRDEHVEEAIALRRAGFSDRPVAP